MGHSIADNRDLTLWAESPEEARTFLARMRRSGHELQIRDVFVAKRSPRMRTNRYIDGRYFTAPAEYFLTTGDDDIDVFNTTVPAPARIQDLVQWCTCDVMLSRGATPIVVVEDTTHIVRMNLYQRVPRLARAAMLGVPSVVLQGTVGLEFRLRGDRWALYRYLQAFSAIARIYPTAPCLPLWYLPSEQDEREQEAILASHVQALVDVDTQKIAADRTEILAKVQRVLSEGVDGEVPPDLPSIDYAGAEVIVRIGAQPDKVSWRNKGSGQMDPYVGLIAAAKYIYCYDHAGQKVKDLVVEFTYLPPNFWFFQNPETTALYKRLPFEFADQVRFLG